MDQINREEQENDEFIEKEFVNETVTLILDLQSLTWEIDPKP